MRGFLVYYLSGITIATGVIVIGGTISLGVVSAYSRLEARDQGPECSRHSNIEASVDVPPPPPFRVDGKGLSDLTPRKDGAYSRSELERLARDAAGLCGVREDIFLRLIDAESGWDPDALSPVGAQGLGQMMPETIKGISPTLRAWEPWDNLVASACHLRRLRDEEGSYEAALWAYNAGQYRRSTGPGTRAFADRIMGVTDGRD